MGGVTKRFPDQRFSFLEGGVAWAAMLFATVISHWEKRNPEAIRTHMNANRFSEAEKDELQALIARYGGAILARSGPKVVEQVETGCGISPAKTLPRTTTGRRSAVRARRTSSTGSWCLLPSGPRPTTR